MVENSQTNNEELEEDDEEIFLEYKAPMTGRQRKAIGHSAERRIAKLFREEWKQEYCETSRANSKLLDKCGIDFDFVPMRVQLKAGKQLGLVPVKELLYVHTQSIKFLPEDDKWLQKPKVLIVAKTGTSGKQRLESLDTVYMTEQDFKSILKLPDNKVIKIVEANIRTLRNKESKDNEFDTLVSMSLNYWLAIVKIKYPPHLKIKK